jgi:hypothetical protein
MLYRIGEPEDEDPAKVRSVTQGCGESGSSIYRRGASMRKRTLFDRP